MNEPNPLATTTTSPPQPLPLTAQKKAELVQQFLQSGLSLRQFSRQNAIGYMSLYRQVRKVRGVVAPRQKPEPVVEFTEIKLPTQATRAEWAVELTLPNGTVLRMTKDTPPTLVEQLLRVC